MATINEISSSSGLPNSQMYMECSIDYTGTNMIIGTSTLGSGLSYIYVSNNGGTTWTSTLNSTSTGWHSVSCSQNGQYMVAGNYIGQIYVSNNSGNTWTLASSTYGTYTSPSFIISLSVNNSGFILASIQFDNSNGKQNLFYSPNQGTTWYFQDLGGLEPLYIGDCAISNSSTSSSIPEFMCCVTQNYLGYAGGIWIYTNTTANWVNYGTDASWNSIAINNNGQYLATSIVGDSSIYVSSNYGVNSNLTNSPSGQNFGLTMNGAGNVICYYQSSGNINLSLDFGNTWQSPLNIPTSQTAIENMAINGLGNKILVCGVSKNNLTGCYIIDLQNSNPPTNYLVGGTDLSEIFQPYSGGVKASPTYYNVNGIDLCNIFDPISLGTSINFNTNIMVNGNDLKNIFAAQIKYVTTGNPTVKQLTNYTVLTYNNSGTITFNTTNNVTVNYLVVGGGGSGGSGGSYLLSSVPMVQGEIFCGSGGGSGNIVNGSMSISPNAQQQITIGSGGICTNYTPQNGSPSSFSTINASGGNCGQNCPYNYNSYNNIFGGQSSFGNGGNGEFWTANYPPYYTIGSGSNPASYQSIYQNFMIDGSNVGTFGGGGGGGFSSKFNGDYGNGLTYVGTGSGGNGGMPGNNNNSMNGTNGGGGGGASTSNTNSTSQNYNQNGGSGGNGVVVLWFLNNIS